MIVIQMEVMKALNINLHPLMVLLLAFGGIVSMERMGVEDLLITQIELEV